MQPLFEGLATHFDQTTDISAALLSDAINQTTSEITVGLIRAIAEGWPAELVERVTRAALRIGSTSGADSAAGLLLGLAACATHP